MSLRLFIATILASLLGGIVYLFVVEYEGSAAVHSGSSTYQSSTFIFAALIALVFEVVVLLPTTIFFKAIAKSRVLFILFGVASWCAVTAGLLMATGMNTVSLLMNTYQSLLLGVPVVVAFVLIRGKAHNDA